MRWVRRTGHWWLRVLLVHVRPPVTGSTRREAPSPHLITELSPLAHPPLPNAPFPPRPPQCFFEKVEANNKLMGSFEVISGGLLDIDVAVRLPEGGEEGVC
jgi:hypothetical protein